MHAIEDIDGVTVARALASEDSISLQLMAPSGFSESHFYPAESLAITSLEGVAALHNLCERLMEAYAEANQS